MRTPATRSAMRWVWAALAIAAALAFMACSSGDGDGGEVGQAAVMAGDDEESLTLKVMSFNLLWGAGHDRRFDINVPDRFKGRDRTQELIEFLRDADPDVLALEEAAGWDDGLAAQVASELGMHYVLAPDAWELHVVLLSKYPIVAADAVSRYQGFNGVALQATLAVTPEVDVNVLAAHLNSMSRETRSCQVQALMDMSKDLKGRTLLLGDMNFRPGTPQEEMLRTGGWQLVQAQAQWPIDQIWLDGAGTATTGTWWQGLEAPAGISDHFPVGVDITFVAPKHDATPVREAVTAPGVLNYACDVPQ